MVISTALSSTISEDCLGRGVGVDEVMIHTEIVAKLMGNDLFDGKYSTYFYNLVHYWAGSLEVY